MGKPRPSAAIARLFPLAPAIIPAPSGQRFLYLPILDRLGILGDLVQVFFGQWSLGSLGEEVQYEGANAQNLRQ